MSDLIRSAFQWLISDEDHETDESDDSTHQQEDDDAPQLPIHKEEDSDNHSDENNIEKDDQHQDSSSERQPLLAGSRSASHTGMTATKRGNGNHRLSDSLSGTTDIKDKANEEVIENVADGQEEDREADGFNDPEEGMEYTEEEAEELQRALNQSRLMQSSRSQSGFLMSHIIPRSLIFLLIGFLIKNMRRQNEDDQVE